MQEMRFGAGQHPLVGLNKDEARFTLAKILTGYYKDIYRATATQAD